MKKSQLLQLIREEIEKSAKNNDDTSKVTSLVPLLINAIDQVDDNLSYKDFAEAIAVILTDEYGSHNFHPFMEVLHGKLGIESVNEAEFKHISPKENKIKDAIKDVEKKFRLKANRDNPPQYAQLSLNKIMLSKVLGREELGKEHQGAWEKLKKEYNLR